MMMTGTPPGEQARQHPKSMLFLPGEAGACAYMKYPTPKLSILKQCALLWSLMILWVAGSRWVCWWTRHDPDP